MSEELMSIKMRIFTTLLICLLFVAVITGWGFMMYSIFYPEPVPSKTPFDDVYEITFYHEDYGEAISFTSDSMPEVKDNTITIYNYWEQDFDEDGNEEWVRKEFDEYYCVIPLSDKLFIEVNHITDINNTATTIELWTWDEYLTDMIDSESGE